MGCLNSGRTHKGLRSSLWLIAFFCLTVSSALAQSAVTPGAANILIYSATKGFRHDSIPTAVQALKSRSAGHNITFEDTEDFTWFREDRLGKYDVIVFLSTTGESESFDLRFGVQHRLKALHSSRRRGKECLPELPQQRRKFRCNPLRERFAEHHCVLWARSWSVNPQCTFKPISEVAIGAFFDYHPPISTAVSEIAGLRLIPTQFASTDRQRAYQGSPKYQYAPRQMGGHR